MPVTHHIDINEFSARSDDVASWLQRGDDVLISRCGKMMFRVSSIDTPQTPTGTTTTAGPPCVSGAPGKRILGLRPGTTTTGPDFNDPLPESFWSGRTE